MGLTRVFVASHRVQLRIASPLVVATRGAWHLQRRRAATAASPSSSPRRSSSSLPPPPPPTSSTAVSASSQACLAYVSSFGGVWCCRAGAGLPGEGERSGDRPGPRRQRASRHLQDLRIHGVLTPLP